MKIEIGKHPNNVKFKDDSGTEIKDLHVRSLTIECEVDQINTAFLEVQLIEATVDAVPNYIVGKHKNVRGIILEDGTLEYFPECKPVEQVDENLTRLGVARAGDVVFIKANVNLSKKSAEILHQHFARTYQKTGIHFIILDQSLDVMRLDGDKSEMEKEILKSHKVSCDQTQVKISFNSMQERDSFLKAYTDLRMKQAREDLAAQAVS